MHIKLRIEQCKPCDGLWCSGRVSSSCSTSGTRRVNQATNPMISLEWAKDWEVLTTSGTYPWSFVTQIFHSGQPSHEGDHKAFSSSAASLLAATPYQGNYDGNHKLCNIVSTENYFFVKCFHVKTDSNYLPSNVRPFILLLMWPPSLISPPSARVSLMILL